MLIYKTCIYINIIKAHKTCYAHSPSITPKVSSYGLINKYEQFNLNYSTKPIFSQKYFMNAIYVNSETLGLLFTATLSTAVPLCEPEIHSHFRPQTHHNTICSINYTLAAQTVSGLSRTVQMASTNFHTSVSRFGSDQTDVQGLKPTESSAKHLIKV